MQHPVVQQVSTVLTANHVRSTAVAVGFSGGVDSVALLHVLRQLQSAHDLRLSALHVHHGLSPNADAWTEHCATLCSEWHVPLAIHRVSVDKTDLRGVEAAARAARYACYRDAPVKFVALAHHQDDQAETVLLQMLRGAGVAGMAAMPVLRAPGPGPLILRPLLQISRDELLKYAQDHALRWIEDESNDDVTYARNFVRHRVLPIVSERFPGYRTGLARVAENAADAAMLLDEVGHKDLQAMSNENTIDVNELRAMSSARSANVLRVWLTSQGLQAPSREHLLELLEQALNASQDAQLDVSLGHVSVRRYQDRLSLLVASGEASPWEVEWHGEPAVALPDGRTLSFDVVTGEGIAREALQDVRVSIGFRRGGERLCVAPNRPRRTLKNLLQECNIPPWERDRLPLLFVDDRLVWAYRIGADPEYCAGDGSVGYRLNVR